MHTLPFMLLSSVYFVKLLHRKGTTFSMETQYCGLSSKGEFVPSMCRVTKCLVSQLTYPNNGGVLLIVHKYIIVLSRQAETAKGFTGPSVDSTAVVTTV